MKPTRIFFIGELSPAILKHFIRRSQLSLKVATCPHKFANTLLIERYDGYQLNICPS